MVTKRPRPEAGGYRRPIMTLEEWKDMQRGADVTPKTLGEWIRDWLARGPSWAFDMYKAYKAQMKQIPTKDEATAILKARRRFEVEGLEAAELETRRRALETQLEAHQERVRQGWTSRRRTISYLGLIAYIYALRKLGLVEYTGNTWPAVRVIRGEETELEYLSEVQEVRAVPGTEGDERWHAPVEEIKRG